MSLLAVLRAVRLWASVQQRARLFLVFSKVSDETHAGHASHPPPRTDEN